MTAVSLKNPNSIFISYLLVYVSSVFNTEHKAIFAVHYWTTLLYADFGTELCILFYSLALAE
jgi:hypothetical protein